MYYYYYFRIYNYYKNISAFFHNDFLLFRMMNDEKNTIKTYRQNEIAKSTYLLRHKKK